MKFNSDGTGSGTEAGARSGTAVGAGNGTTVGAGRGTSVGAGNGAAVGTGSGTAVGAVSGTAVGAESGAAVGAGNGMSVGAGRGTAVGMTAAGLTNDELVQLNEDTTSITLPGGDNSSIMSNGVAVRHHHGNNFRVRTIQRPVVVRTNSGTVRVTRV